MARLATALRASVAIGITMTGTAIAQTAPNPLEDPNDIPMGPNTSTKAETDTTIHTTVPEPVVVPAEEPTFSTQQTTYAALPPPIVITDNDHDMPMSGIGIAIAAGGGAGGFTNDAMRNSTNVGGDWDVRATFGTRSPLAIEGSYIGSAQQIAALGLTNDAVLVGNGVQGALRLNATLNMPIQPFLFAGAAWRHYDLDADTNLSDVNNSDDVLEIPMGVGLAGRWNGLILDARGEFRASTNEDLMAETSEDEVEDALNVDPDQFAPMHRWGVKATVGFEF